MASAGGADAGIEYYSDEIPVGVTDSHDEEPASESEASDESDVESVAALNDAQKSDIEESDTEDVVGGGWGGNFGVGAGEAADVAVEAEAVVDGIGMVLTIAIDDAAA